MKRIFVVIAVVLAATLFVSSDLIGGRGGRGGGGRGGGGGHPAVGGGGGAGIGDRGGGLGAGGGGHVTGGPGPAIGGGSAGGKVGGGSGGKVAAGGAGKGPNAGQLGNFLDIGSPGAGPKPGGLPAGGPSAVGDFFQKGPGVGPPGGGAKIAGKMPGVGQGKVGQAAAANRPNRVENRQQLSQQRQDRRQEIQNEFRDNHPRWDFAMEHPRWATWRVNRPYRWAAAAALTGWCGFGSESYYDYGENIYYQDNAVYSDGQQIATADQYAAASEQIATSIPQVKDPDWMPLGVFAMTQDGKASGPTPTMFLQLNVSKEGIIAGTFQNAGTNTTQPIEGMVDKKSQRAAWVVCGKNRPIMETGVFNLTKDTAPALMHFADGQTQQWLLVRMDEPKQ